MYVFVHGFKGSNYDLRLWKDAIKLRGCDKEVLVFSPQCNEGVRSEDDIAEMGYRLAMELRDWVLEHCPKENFKKISFVAHSIGGMVVRAALPHLERYQHKMYSLVTLGTPHLGYLVNTKTVIKSGFWFLRKMK